MAQRSALPKWQEGRHPHCHFRGLSGFTRVTARRIAQPPKVTFVTRRQPCQLPSRAARQLPGLIDNYPGGTLLHLYERPGVSFLRANNVSRRFFFFPQFSSSAPSGHSPVPAAR